MLNGLIGIFVILIFFSVSINHTNAIEPSLDLDGDGIINIEDNCIGVRNTNQLDTDKDGVGDFCDWQPYIINDSDNDGIFDGYDKCRLTSTVNQKDMNKDGCPDHLVDLPEPIPEPEPEPIPQPEPEPIPQLEPTVDLETVALMTEISTNVVVTIAAVLGIIIAFLTYRFIKNNKKLMQ